MNSKNLPWPELHRPTSLTQLAGNVDAIKGLKEWVQSWISGSPTRRAALLIGPPGVGKTASVGALSHDYDLELVEFNSSDKRNKGSIENQVWKAATQQTLDGRLRLLLLDEVDGLSGTSDRGGVGAILKIIQDTVHPIIMTANDPSSPRLKDLLKTCKVFRFDPIEPDDMVSVIRKIAAKHDSQFSDEVLEGIVDRAGGDLRAAISDLETLFVSGRTSDEGLPFRDVRREVGEVFGRLFMTTDPEAAKRVISELDIDHDQLLLWLEENVHLHLATPEELDQGFEYLSLADLSLGRIWRRQNWKLLAYVYDFLAVGVSTSRKVTPYRNVEYSRSSWPMLIWRGNRKRDKESNLLRKLSGIASVSKNRAARTHKDAIMEIVKQNPRLKEIFSNWLGVKKSFFDERSSRR
ncbi:MAG: replication factor C large subunit [Candidatus Thorarchaeota archaeon]|jgi:replication factor C large subunit